MKARHWLAQGISWVAAAIILSGCGGGGGSSSGSGAGSGTMGIFVTDRFSDDFSQVWVTVFKVEGSTDGTHFQTLFNNPAGVTLNVAALANIAHLLGNVTVPNARFSQIRVTLADHLTLVSPGGSSQSVPVDPSSASVANGLAVLTFNVTPPASATQLGNLVIDFDLASFELLNGQVRPHLQRGDDGKFQRDQKDAEVEGTVTNLSAGSGFTLTEASGATVPVRIAGTTDVFSEGQGRTITLADGQKVEVKGSFDPATQAISADTVKIEDVGNGNDGQEGDNPAGAGAEGTVSSVDTGNQSFLLSLEQTERFQPSAGSVTVKTVSSTVFHRHQGDDNQTGFSAVVTGGRVEVTGTFDSATQALTATRVEIK